MNRSPVLPLLLALGASGAPAEAQAPAETGLLRVQASAPGAVVFVDGERVGEAPLTTYVAAGDHTVRITADNFDPFVRRVSIIPNRTVDLRADLIPGGSTVEFIVEPSGATLTMNGKDSQPTPVRLRDVQPGTHQWTLEARGHEPKSGSFRFERGQNLLIQERLESSAGRLSFRTRPEGADVFLDGQKVGSTPLELAGVPLGPHQVLLDLPGHASVVRSLDTTDGSKGVVDLKLPEQGGKLVVRTPDSAGLVRLNGVRIGQGRKVRLPEVERGRYTLLVSLPDGAFVEERIEVEDTGANHYKATLQGDALRIKPTTPLTRNWLVWAGVATVASGAAAGGIIAWNASIPDPIPEGDVLVELP